MRVMKPIRVFSVVPSLPPELEDLRELAYNLRWAWNHEAIELFRRLDSDLWESSGHNPVLMLGTIDQMKLESARTDETFLAHLERVSRDFKAYVSGESSWFRRACRRAGQPPLVAYFSAEFGVTECLSIFAGGLGILAGDHLKSASDLGVPLVGVGLLYQQGYFHQYLNQGGWQQEAYEDNDFHNLPLRQVQRADGAALTVQVQFPGRLITAQVWRAQAGRVPLYLLDTNIPANARPEDRDITDALYGGDREMRLKQEILLGIGGYRALEALGLEPTVCHMNEGHAAFVGLELVRRLMETRGLNFSQARELASASLVFTGHTPVLAGHDYFSPDLVSRYLGDYARMLGLSQGDFLALGRERATDGGEFCMTILALRLAAHSNGVSKLHGEVARKMWQVLWPGVPENEVPIGHVTNGVHFQSWISYEMNQLYDRYLGPKWREEPGEQALWQRVENIPAEELWRTHERRRERLVAFTRRRLREQLQQRSAPQREIEAAEEVLDPEALTIGFARRFATYKRATLLLRDAERLGRILNGAGRPVQVIYAGKAHPRDDAGKELIRQVVNLARREEFRRRLVFLENYDLTIARYLVQGVDVWLNTPLRPQEASGTSGMKAAANGALNLSILDGWWDEAWRGPELRSSPIGWAIGHGEIFDNPEYQNQVEAEALYDLLERDAVPTFYERGADRLPRRWIGRMKASIGILCHFFNTHRMVRDYTEAFYLPSHARYLELEAERAARAKALAAWLDRVREQWPQVRVEAVDDGPASGLPVGAKTRIGARLNLGALKPEDVAVELYLGRMDPNGEIVEAQPASMQPVRQVDQSRYLFEATAVPCSKSGLHGYTVRVLPHHPDLPTRFLPGLIAWADAGV
jgi:starch phosphorylase